MKRHTTQPIACISDICGNKKVLESVLHEVRDRGAETVVALGNHFFGATDSDPFGTWQMLQHHKVKMLRGVQETALCQIDATKVVAMQAAEADRLAEFARVQGALGQIVLEQVRRLPTSLRLPLMDGSEALFVHGSPRDYSEEIFLNATDEEVAFAIDDDVADVVFCSGAHEPFTRTLGDLVLVGAGSLNPVNETHSAFATLQPAMTGSKVEANWYPLG